MQKDFEQSTLPNHDLYQGFDPNFHHAVESFAPETIQHPLGPAVLPEGHPLEHIQNDFKFDFNEYDNHKK